VAWRRNSVIREASLSEEGKKKSKKVIIFYPQIKILLMLILFSKGKRMTFL
jgi:hypothetical protein